MFIPTSQSERLNAAFAGRYQVERELGAGGMATVYLAADLKHDRKVAIKVLKPELAAVLGAERFVVEIKTTASLSHPHILQLFDSGTADGFLFYVMPYIEGETIREKLNRETQFGVNEGVRIAREVADALDYAHRHGVIHRDIKPENLLLHDGRAMVMDFGIALAVSAAAGGRMTETGLSLGTPHYMSPEQATAEKDLTGRSDVYSLGSVLFEMLAGQPPHVGGSAQQIIMKIITEDAPPLTQLRKSVPPHVAAAVMRALEKLPADRFTTAKEFSDALANPAFATGLTAAGRETNRRARLDWRLAAVGGLLLGALGAWMLVPRATVAAIGGDTRAQLTFNGHSLHPAISPDGKHVAYTERRCPHGPWYGCRWSLVTLERGSNRPITVIDSALLIGIPRFSVDGKSLFVNAELDSSRSGLYAVPRLGGVPRRISDAHTFDQHAMGDTLVLAPNFAVGRFARFVLAASGAVVDSVPLPLAAVDDIAWSPDGAHLVVTTDYRRLTVMGRDGRVTDSLIGAFRPTARWMKDGSGFVLFRALEGLEDDLDFYPIGRDGRLGKREVILRKVATLTAGEFDLSRDAGTMVLATGSAIYDLWTFDFSGNARQRTSGTTWYGEPAISPDGHTLYYQRGDVAGDNVYRLTLPDREEALTADSVPSGFTATNVSRDGRRLTFGQSVGAGIRTGFLDLVSRQVAFESDRGDASTSPIPLDRGLVYGRANGRGLLMVDSLGGPGRNWLLPDSTSLQAFDVGPGGKSVALILRTRDAQLLATSPLDRFEPKVLYRFASNDIPYSLSWSDDGWISFKMRRGDESPALWGVRATGGPLTRRAQLPAMCNARGIRIAAAAPVGACLSSDLRPDIWVLDLPRLKR